MQRPLAIMLWTCSVCIQNATGGAHAHTFARALTHTRRGRYSESDFASTLRWKKMFVIERETYFWGCLRGLVNKKRDGCGSGVFETITMVYFASFILWDWNVSILGYDIRSKCFQVCHHRHCVDHLLCEHIIVFKAIIRGICHSTEVRGQLMPSCDP